MGYLIGVNTLNVLVCRSCVVNLIKICAVEVILVIRNYALLIAQLDCIGAVFQKLAVFALYGDLAEIQSVICANTDISCLRVNAVNKLGTYPLKQRRIVLTKLRRFVPIFAVVGVFERI